MCDFFLVDIEQVSEYLHLTGCGFCCFFLGIFQTASLFFPTSPCRLPQPSAHSHLFGRYLSVFLCKHVLLLIMSASSMQFHIVNVQLVNSRKKQHNVITTLLNTAELFSGSCCELFTCNIF